MRKLLLTVSLLFLVSTVFGQLIINEVDADQTSTDSAEFLELYDGGAGNTSLDGYVVVLFNGSDDASYDAIDLDGYSTDANGYFVIGSASVANVDLIEFTTNGIQNGADAVALFTGDATDFPEDTPVTTNNLIDALVYDTNDGDDAGLLVLLNASQPQINEDEGGAKDTESMQRSPNGSGGARNTDTYVTATPTPGAENSAPPATPSIVRAYTRTTTEMDVVYDIDVTTVDPADYTLSGTDNITFTTATIDGTDAKIVHLSGGSPNMTSDLTQDTITDANGFLDFYAGVLEIKYTNTNNPGGTIPDNIDATFTGIISADDAYNNVWISDSFGAYNGVMIYSNAMPGLVDVGDLVLIAARRDEYNDLTELVDPILISVLLTGQEPYGPDLITGADIAETLASGTNPGESWEGQLVKIENFYVESSGNYFYRCTDDGGSNYFYVGDNVDYHFGDFSLTVGQTYQEIIGVVDWYSSGPYYRINPRDGNDQTLPVTLSSFTASAVANSFISLQWTTQSETGMVGYLVYRSEGDFNQALAVSDYIQATNTTQAHDYSYEDHEAAVGVSYNYWLQGVEQDGSTSLWGPLSVMIEEEVIPELPSESILKKNYPNPFNPVTKISLAIKEAETGTLTIYNSKGQVVENVTLPEGEHVYEWDAAPYGSGMYLYKLTTPSYSETKKMIMLK